jgi:MazG family protein
MQEKNKAEAFVRLLKVMDDLRAQCPWDREQTKESIRHLSIEEVYELSDAILANDYDEIKEELGDVLLHIVFYSKMAEEKSKFDIADVANAICDKLIERHPHIYGDVKADTADAVKQNWERIKQKSGGKRKDSVLSGVPDSLPPLVKSLRMQEKVAQVGFDWPNKKDVWSKVEEETQEFLEETDKEKKEVEFGDLLFALVNYARFENINPDDALSKTNIKFKKRFQYLEKVARDSGRDLGSMTLDEMNAIWEEAKSVAL